MFIAGAPLGPLGTIQDELLRTFWLRREQLRIFEANINVLVGGLSLDPGLGSKIDNLMQEYIEMLMPGAKESKKKNDEAFIAKTSKSLEKIAELLASAGGGKVDKEKAKRDLFRSSFRKI